MKKKITPLQRLHMKELKKLGYTLKEIADIFNVSIDTVFYWLNEENRRKRKERQRKIAKKKYESMSPEEKRKQQKATAEYIKKQYKENPIFREKIKERARKRNANSN